MVLPKVIEIFWFQINIDSCVRKQIQANLQQANPDLFDCAQAQIYQLMERDSFRRFSNQTKQRSQAWRFRQFF